MAQDDSNEFFGHLNQPASQRRARPSSGSNPKPGSGDYREVPDPFEEGLDPEHPLNSSGRTASLPERGRVRTRKPTGPGLSPGVPRAPDKPPTREVQRSGVVLTPGGVKRVDENAPKPAARPASSSQVRHVVSEKVSPPPSKAQFHDASRAKNDQEDVSWEEYAADGFPAMAAEEFGVKTKRTDTGRMVPVAVRSDLTEEALKNRSIKGGKGKRRPTRAAGGGDAAPQPPRSIWGRIGDSLRLTRPVLEEGEGQDEEASRQTKKTQKGFARSGSLPTKKRGSRKTPLGMAWSVFVEVLKILMLVLLLRAYVVQVSMVQGPSMEGTLINNDRLVVERVTPLIANNQDQWWLSWLPDFLTPELQRGDLVVVRSPEDPGLELVKRLIALPGDTIRFEDGKLWLKPAGESTFSQVREDYLSAEPLKNDDGTFRSYGRGDLGRYISEGQDVLVPADRIFVLGDNRMQSNDSRRWLEINVSQPGVDRLWLHRNSVEGRVIFRIWPFDRVWPPVK